MLLLHCAEDSTGMYRVDWHVTTRIHHVTTNCGAWDRPGGSLSYSTDGPAIMNKVLVSDWEENNPNIVPTAWQLLCWKGGSLPHLKARIYEKALAGAPNVLPRKCTKTGKEIEPRCERNVVSPLKLNGMFNAHKIKIMQKAADPDNKDIMITIEGWLKRWDEISKAGLQNGGFVDARDEDDVVQRCQDRGKACQEGRDKAKLKRDEALKVTPTIAKGTKGVPKQAKQKLSPSQEIGMVTPRDGNNVPKRASSPTSGNNTVLEEAIVEYKNRIVNLEIDIEDLKSDVKDLRNDKSLLLQSFGKAQGQYGQASGRLAIFEMLHKEKMVASGVQSGDTTATTTTVEPMELPAGLSAK